MGEGERDNENVEGVEIASLLEDESVTFEQRMFSRIAPNVSSRRWEFYDHSAAANTQISGLPFIFVAAAVWISVIVAVVLVILGVRTYLNLRL